MSTRTVIRAEPTRNMPPLWGPSLYSPPKLWIQLSFTLTSRTNTFTTTLNPTYQTKPGSGTTHLLKAIASYGVDSFLRLRNKTLEAEPKEALRDLQFEKFKLEIIGQLNAKIPGKVQQVTSQIMSHHPTQAQAVAYSAMGAGTSKVGDVPTKRLTLPMVTYLIKYSPASREAIKRVVHKTYPDNEPGWKMWESDMRLFLKEYPEPKELPADIAFLLTPGTCLPGLPGSCDVCGTENLHPTWPPSSCPQEDPFSRRTKLLLLLPSPVER